MQNITTNIAASFVCIQATLHVKADHKLSKVSFIPFFGRWRRRSTPIYHGLRSAWPDEDFAHQDAALRR